MGGTYGVITYDIAGTNYMVAVMWSVPYDFGSYDIWYNVKVRLFDMLIVVTFRHINIYNDFFTSRWH